MTDGGVGSPIPDRTDDGWGFLVSPYPSVERNKTIFGRQWRGRGGSKWSHLPTTKTVQQYMDTWRHKTPRGQLGFPKTLDELRELKEFADRQVRCDQWNKRWLWKARVEERLQFTRCDEARDERAGVGAARTTKRLERERKTEAGGYTTTSIYPSSIFHWQSVRPTPSYAVGVCISSFPDEVQE
jgi:hypothetical protein